MLFLAALLRSLRVVKFKLSIDHTELNDMPAWVALAIIPEMASVDTMSRQTMVSND